MPIAGGLTGGGVSDRLKVWLILGDIRGGCKIKWGTIYRARTMHLFILCIIPCVYFVTIPARRFCRIAFNK